MRQGSGTILSRDTPFYLRRNREKIAPEWPRYSVTVPSVRQAIDVRSMRNTACTTFLRHTIRSSYKHILHASDSKCNEAPAKRH